MDRLDRAGAVLPYWMHAGLRSTARRPLRQQMSVTAEPQFGLCLERTKAEASQGAAFVDTCAPCGGGSAETDSEGLQAMNGLEESGQQEFWDA